MGPGDLVMEPEVDWQEPNRVSGGMILVSWNVLDCSSEFHQWIIHLNTHRGPYCPYSLVSDPQNFLNFQKL